MSAKRTPAAKPRRPRAPNDAKELWVRIGCQVRGRRRAAGMTIDEMAARLGVSPEQLGRLELGASGTTLYRLLQVANVLGVRLSEIVDADGSTSTGDVTITFSARGLTEDDIRKIIDYAKLISKARQFESLDG